MVNYKVVKIGKVAYAVCLMRLPNVNLRDYWRSTTYRPKGNEDRLEVFSTVNSTIIHTGQYEIFCQLKAVESEGLSQEATSSNEDEAMTLDSEVDHNVGILLKV